ncbi:MAG: ABC transporter substrate-binding protein [Treponema sp.]|nr:ABC transporter substrate-binding protein [Treponema sp.]
MKKLICVILTLAFTIPLAFAAGGGEAKGKITIYTSMYQEVIDKVKIELDKRFPRCHINFVYGGSGRLEHMIETERAAGRLGCDIIMTAEPTYALELKEKGLLHRYLSKEALNLAYDYDREGYWHPVRINNMILAFNPDRYSKNSIPNSFREFANDTRVRGAISMRNPNISGTSLATLSALRDKYGYEFIDSLARQNVRIEYGSAGTIQKLENGEYRAAMILEETILQLREHGSRLEVIYPTDGTVMIPSPIMIINNRWSANKNSSSAQAIVDWFLSEYGQRVIVSGWMHSVRIDFPQIPFDSKPTGEIRENSIPVNWDSASRRSELLTRFERGR